MVIYSLDVLLSQFGTSPLFHVWFCCFLIWRQISQGAGRVVWYSHLLKNFPQFVVVHTVKGFGIVNKAEIIFFSRTLLLFQWSSGFWQFDLCFSAFSKSSLNICKFLVHVLLKPGLEIFEHYFTSVWDERNCVVVWAFFGIDCFGIGMKTDFFQSCGHCCVFQICSILSAAFSQHHLLGSEMAQLEFHHLH